MGGGGGVLQWLKKWLLRTTTIISTSKISVQITEKLTQENIYLIKSAMQLYQLVLEILSIIHEKSALYTLSFGASTSLAVAYTFE